MLLKTILIDDNNLTDENAALLQEFEITIYNKSFPDNEREEFVDIIERIKTPKPWEPETFAVIQTHNENIVGGVIGDYYNNCKCLEIIYIALNPNYRGMGNGCKLLWKSVDVFTKRVGEIRNIFIEVEKVHNRSLMEYEMDSSKRIDFWVKRGAKQILIDYTQPPLTEGKDAIHNLMLMVLPLQENMEIVVSKSTLKEFLKDFYIGLKAEKSPFLNKMLSQIDKSVDFI